MTHSYNYLHIYFFSFLWVYLRDRIQNNADIGLLFPYLTSGTISWENGWQQSLTISNHFLIMKIIPNPSINTGMHFVFSNSNVTSSEAILHIDTPVCFARVLFSFFLFSFLTRTLIYPMAHRGPVKRYMHRRIAGGAWGCRSTPKLLQKSEIFRLSEILRRRSEIFITYFYKNVLSFYFTNYEVLIAISNIMKTDMISKFYNLDAQMLLSEANIFLSRSMQCRRGL